MCGITGIITATSSAEQFRERLHTMTEAMSHRGPDDAGADVVSPANPAVLFGHRRLAIIDLSAAGHQPMHDSASDTWITFNGEIYNYRELRHELEQLGQVFRSQTDTEVILKAYAVWGTACVNHLRGIFAFGLWDNPRQVLLLARDQLLTRSLDGMLPSQCVYRQKRGFELPFAVWLRESLQEEIQASFVGQTEDNAMPFTPSGLARLWQQFERGQVGWSRVWGVFVLRRWLGEHNITKI